MKNSQKTKAQLTQELEALRRINHTIGTTLALNEVLQRIINEIVPLFAAQSGSVILFDAARKEAELTTTYGKRAPEGHPIRYPWAGTMSEWVVEQQRPLRVPRLTAEAWPRSWKLAQELGGTPEQTSALMVPLWQDAQTIGCLEILWEPLHVVTDSEEELLVATATQATIAITNARLYQEKEQALQRAKESEERFRRIVETAQEGIWVLNAEAKTVYANQRIAEMLGYNVHEMLGRPLFAFMDEAAREEAVGYFARRKQGIQEKHDFRFCKKDGEHLWAIVSASPMLDEQGNFLGAFGMLTDITERKQVEEALRKSEARFRTLVQYSSDILTILDANGTIRYQSPSIERVLGYEPEQLINTNVFMHLHPEDRQKVQSAFAEALPRPGTVTAPEFRFRHANGSWVYLEAIGNNLLTDPEIQGVVINSRNVTERKHMEEALRESETRFRTLIRDLQVGVILQGPNAEVLVSNRAALDLLGLTEEQLLGKTSLDPDWQVIHEDGSPFPGETHPVPQAIATRHPVQDVVMGVRRPAGSDWVWLLVNADPHVAADGRVSQAVCTFIDITERKRVEEQQQKFHAQLLQTQKLEAVGTLAGGIAHDFNNILSAILGYAELVTDDVPVGTVARRNLEEILRASRRAKELVQQLLTFSRPEQKELQLVRLRNIIEETLTLLRPSLPRTIVIQSLFNAGDETVLANRTQVQQVIMNLCVNAAYAMGEGRGSLGIALDRVENGEVTEFAADNLKEGAYLRLTVSDTGCGIAPDVLDHIFEPFFTTKPVGQGSGMGLAIVHGIVKSHGGTITIASKLGQGTTVHIYWPLIASEEASKSAKRELPH